MIAFDDCGVRAARNECRNLVGIPRLQAMLNEGSFLPSTT